MPEKLKGNETGWQTKSLDCFLNTINITEDGKLLCCQYIHDENEGEKIEQLDYTGEVRFYQTIFEMIEGKPNDYWCEFVAFFENGQMLKLIQIAPNGA